MDFEQIKQREYSQNRDMSISGAFPILMRKVYLWMTLALVITGFTAFGVASSPSILQWLVMNKSAFLFVAIAELALVWGLSAAINRLSLRNATLLFIAYSILNGVTMSFIFLAYTMSSIANVFFITASTFAVMAFYGYVTKTDLSSIGRICIMALIGIIIATLVNVIFLKSSGFDLIVSYIGVLVFVGLTAWDSQKIKNMLLQAPDASEQVQKFALLGALTLYLDFINIFLYLLRIFGRRED